MTYDVNSYYGATAQIVVDSNGTGGLLAASGTAVSGVTFNAASGANSTALLVDAGGELQASYTNFAIGQVSLADNSILASGDLTNNIFANTTLYTPILDVPLLTNNQSFANVDINAGDSLASGHSVTLTLMGTVSTFDLLYVLPGNLTINYGATLAVASNIPMRIGTGATSPSITFADNGLLSFASGDTVTYDVNSYYGATAQIVVDSNGTGGLLAASGTAVSGVTFNAASGANSTALLVDAGGELQASYTNFAIGQVSLADNSILASGDLTNNIFANTTLYTPILDVPLLTNNQSFANVDINAGDSLASGHSVTLTLMGTVSTFDLLYVLPGNLTINYGATLAVASNIPVQIGTGATSPSITFADNGLLSFASGDTVTYDVNSYYGATAQIVVDSNGAGGLLAASGTAVSGVTFNAASGANSTALLVDAGGELQASYTNFAIGQVSLADNSILASGDLTNNIFANTTLYTPILDVPLLTNNQSFANVDINAGDSLASGHSVTLTLMGTVSTFDLLYVLPGNLTINYGATLAVASNIPVQIGTGATSPSITFADNGLLSFASGDTVTYDVNSYYGATAQIVVDSNGAGGLLAASGTAVSGVTFNAASGANSTALLVDAGGELQASYTNFAIGQVSLADNSILASGDLTNNIFANTTLYTPILDVPLLTNNQSFANVDINAGDSLASGQSVTLTLMGTVSTFDLLYVLPGNLTINYGATLAVASNIPMRIGTGATSPSITFADNGLLSFASGDTVTYDVNSYYGATAQIVVDSNGTGGLLAASGTAVSGVTFNAASGANSTALLVDAGGELQASYTNFAIGQVSLADNSILASGDLTNNIFANTTLYTPILDVPLLTNNQSFANVDINAGDSLASGHSVTLTLMGTVSTFDLLYVLPGNLTINYGATLAVASNIPVQIGTGATSPSITFADNGLLSFASGDTVTYDVNSYYGATAQIVVDSNGTGGLLAASGTTFNAASGSNSSAIVVNSGGVFSGTGNALIAVEIMGNGTLSPGAPVGTLNVNNLTLSSGSHVSVTLENGTSGNFGQLSYSGSLSLSGASLAVEAGNISVGEQFTIVTTVSGALTGTFSNAPTTITAANNPEDVFSVSYANDKVTLTVTSVGLAVSAVAINEDISALYNAAGQSSPGTQRSMVDDIVYTFSEPVNISPSDPNVFTVSVAAGRSGTVPTLSWAAVAGSNDTEWAVSFSGNGVTGGSIANGAYTITIADPNSITAVSDGQALSLLPGQAPAAGDPDHATQSFYRLFGDINGDGVVNAADNLQFKQALTTYNAAFDYNGDGIVNASDNLKFKNDLTVNFTGFTPTI